MNGRAKALIGLLTAILLACAALIFLDQNGAFKGGRASAGTSAPSGTAAPAPQPSGSGGFGDLK